MKNISVQDLMKLIEYLEKENKELKDMIANYKGRFSRVEDRDDLLIQYQNELEVAKIRL